MRRIRRVDDEKIHRLGLDELFDAREDADLVSIQVSSDALLRSGFTFDDGREDKVIWEGLDKRRMEDLGRQTGACNSGYQYDPGMS